MTGTVKSIVYGLLAQGGMTHQQIADEVRREIPSAQTSARSVASMAVDYRNSGGVSKSNESRGQVKRLVYAMLEQGGMTHKEIAAAVCAQLPTAQTTYKSVASMAVDFKRQPQSDAAQLELF